MTSVLAPAAATALVSFGLSAEAIGAQRFTFWFSHARWKALVGGVLTFLVLCVASAGGIAASRVALGSRATFFTDLVAAAITQSSLRNMRSKDPTVTLALGFLVEIFSWTETWIANAIFDWAKGLTDDELVDAAARLDDAKAAATTPDSLAPRVQWRQDFGRLLAAGGDARKTARQSLERMIQIGYPTYRIRRPK